jgi:hypothetical protein
MSPLLLKLSCILLVTAPAGAKRFASTKDMLDTDKTLNPSPPAQTLNPEIPENPENPKPPAQGNCVRNETRDALNLKKSKARTDEFEVKWKNTSFRQKIEDCLKTNDPSQCETQYGFKMVDYEILKHEEGVKAGTISADKDASFWTETAQAGIGCQEDKVMWAAFTALSVAGDHMYAVLDKAFGLPRQEEMAGFFLDCNWNKTITEKLCAKLAFSDETEPAIEQAEMMVPDLLTQLEQVKALIAISLREGSTDAEEMSEWATEFGDWKKEVDFAKELLKKLQAGWKPTIVPKTPVTPTIDADSEQSASE